MEKDCESYCIGGISCEGCPNQSKDEWIDGGYYDAFDEAFFWNTNELKTPQQIIAEKREKKINIIINDKA